MQTLCAYRAVSMLDHTTRINNCQMTGP